MPEKSVLISFRVPKELKFSFSLACERADANQSQVIRSLMRAYITQVAQNILIEQAAAKVLPRSEPQA